MNQPHYPFFKLTTDEKFPRLLITRRPENKTKNQNLYGAFLPVGMARRMLDLLHRIFRLRPCELDIAGDFDAPCPEYFLHRCAAPCVADVCSQGEYLEIVEIVHLILAGKGDAASLKIEAKIEQFAAALEYEKAAQWHTAKLAIETIRHNAKWQIDTAKMTDVIVADSQENQIHIYLSTLRRGKIVGRLSFLFDNKIRNNDEIVRRFIEDFYVYYLPKQIYVAADFPERRALEKTLSAKFSRPLKIKVEPPEKLPPSVRTAQNLAPAAFTGKHRKNSIDNEQIAAELQQIFNLKKLPQTIECFDVAHLAGREIVAARIVARNALILRDESLVWEFENLSEPDALAAAVAERLRLLHAKKDRIDLLVLDGGKPQIGAVKKILEQFGLNNPPIIGAVKPPQKHNQISYFLHENRRVEFDKNSRAMNFLQTLRDAAHKLSNETHQRLHSLVQIFKNNDTAPHIRYLLVPTRFAERGGDAENLTPLRALNQSGEVILKTANKTIKKV